MYILQQPKRGLIIKQPMKIYVKFIAKLILNNEVLSLDLLVSCAEVSFPAASLSHLYLEFKYSNHTCTIVMSCLTGSGISTIWIMTISRLWEDGRKTQRDGGIEFTAG